MESNGNLKVIDNLKVMENHVKHDIKHDISLNVKYNVKYKA